MTTLTGHGLTADLPAGWSGEIYDRAPVSTGGATPFAVTPAPVLHAASFALPAVRGDFGGGAVELMRSADAFFALFEHERAAAGKALFAATMPTGLTARDFHPRSLQRPQANQVGCQRFFNRAGRAFCLYVVLGSPAATSLPLVNQLLGSVRID